MKKLLLILLSFFSTYSLATASIGHNWMNQLSSSIEKKSLNQLFIPGSHDSGTYFLENEFAKGQDYSEKINSLKLVNKLIFPIAKNWAQAQNRTISQQLNDGVRYLDLRVTLRDSDNDFYIAHGLFGPKLSDVLGQIKEFLAANPKEIVIIKVGDLNYMGSPSESAKNHERLTQLFLSTFSNLLMLKSEFGEGPKTRVEQVWAKRKQILILYKIKNNDIAEKTDFYWPKTFMDDYWADANNTDDLKEKLEKHMNNRSNNDIFYITQVQMTPSTSTIAKGLIPIGSQYRSLQDMSKDTTKNLSKWIKEWKNRNPNIIITDYTNNEIAKTIYMLNY